jgi:hypothetical protein
MTGAAAEDYKENIRKSITGECPMALWQTNVDVKSLDDFEAWLASQAKQMLTMQLGFMGDVDNDELFTHCAAKGGAFLSALYTFRRARKLEQTPAAQKDTP